MSLSFILVSDFLISLIRGIKYEAMISFDKFTIRAQEAVSDAQKKAGEFNHRIANLQTVCRFRRFHVANRWRVPGFSNHHAFA